MARDPRSFAMALSFWISFLMLTGKVGAYLLTGSAAILSDAAESVVHLGATGFAALSLRYSRQPPDEQHPYGHGKISFFSAGAEGALIFIAALFIVYEGTRALIVGPELHRLHWGLLITGALGFINLLLGLHLIRTGRKHDTLILVANGKHVLTDMWTSLGVLIGVSIVWLTDILWIDPVVGIAMGLNIAWSGVGLIRNAMGGLLDEADPETTNRIQAVLAEAQREGLLKDHHQLRHRKTEHILWVELHMLLPGQLPLEEAHRHVTAIEERIAQAFPRLQVNVTTHLEPAHAHEDHHPGGHTGLEDPLGNSG